MSENYPCLKVKSTGEQIKFQGRIVTIGSSNSCRIRLNESNIPSCIGHFLFKNGTYFFQQLAAGYRFTLNGKLVDGEFSLTHGDELKIGKELYIYLEREGEGQLKSGKDLSISGQAADLAELIDCVVTLLRNRKSNVFNDLVASVSRLLKCDAARLVVENENGERSTIAHFPSGTGLERFSNRAIDWARDKAGTVIVHDTEWSGSDESSENSLIVNSVSSVLCGALHSRSEIIGYLYLDRLKTCAPFSESERIFCDALLPLFSEILVSYQEHQRQMETIARLQSVKLESQSGIIYDCEIMQKTIATAVKVARTDAPILIGGETGTGKELMARLIHTQSQRSGGPFKAINSGAIPENLIESELFGHEKGAFTGASQRKTGLFEAASGGTLFLDEIGELPLALQVKLLRVLQESEIIRIGGTESIHVDVRIIAATNRDLAKEVAEGRFRQDLYFRLNVLTITLPPLRDRGNDIIILTDYFIGKYCQQFGLEQKRISADARDCLLKYGWPGNIRELENVIQKAIITSESTLINGNDLAVSKSEEVAQSNHLSLKEARNKAEKQAIIQALTITHGNVSSSSTLLEIDRKWLMKKMDELGIEADKYRK